MRKLLLIMLLCCSIGAFAQEQRVSMSIHNVTVKEALKSWTLTSYSLWCSSSEMELEKKNQRGAQDKTISEMLDIILTGQQLQYEVKNKVIQIYKMAPVQAPAQESNIITGIVLFEEDNEPVVGIYQSKRYHNGDNCRHRRTFYIERYPSKRTNTDRFLCRNEKIKK